MPLLFATLLIALAGPAWSFSHCSTARGAKGAKFWTASSKGREDARGARWRLGAGEEDSGDFGQFERLEGEFKLPNVADWREMRARLAAGSDDAWQAQLKRARNSQLLGQDAWAHELAKAETGMLLVAGRDQFSSSRMHLHEVVVLVAAHEEHGSSCGVILNRPTNQKVGAMLNVPVFHDNPLYWGGEDTGEALTILHPHGLPRAEDVLPGVKVSFGSEFQRTRTLVEEGFADPDDFRFFIDQCVWGAGELQKEIDDGVWYACATSANVIMKPCIQLPRPLWAEVLDLMGGQYADIAAERYGKP